MTVRISMIGLGRMGSALARGFLRCGAQVTVWNRDPAKAEALRGEGFAVAGSLAEAIHDEELLLAPIIDQADLKIDTTHLNLYQLRDTLKLRLLNRPEPGTAFLFESFGFKRGMPVDADLVFDVRCLPNPYWKADLREFSGLDQPVIEYLSAQADVEEMFQDIHAYLNKWLPRFAASNRAYVTVAIGCTGGHHRSVYLAERLGQALRDPLKNVQVRHRDLA